MAHEPTSPLSLHDPTQKLFENVHPSLHPIIKFLLKKASGKKVKSMHLRRLFENYSHYKMFIHSASLQYLRSVYVSEYYVVLIRETPDKPYSRYTFTYVVGVNTETNKLFVTRHFPFLPNGNLILEKGTVSFYRCDYKEIRELAYGIMADLDLDDESEIKEKLNGVKNNLNVRVQGDIVAILTDTSIETYKSLIKRQLAEFIAHEISRHIANKIVDIMLENSLTATIIDGGVRRRTDTQSVRVLIPVPAFSLYRKDKEKLYKILVKLVKMLKSMLDVEDVKEYLQLNNIEVSERIDIDAHMCCNSFNVDVKTDSKTFLIINIIDFIDGIGFDVDTRAEIIQDTRKINEITEKLMNEIELKPTTISFGRHRINVEEALPTRITAKIDVLNDTRMITFEAPLIVRGSVTFTHPEHKTKVLYFDDFVEFDVRSVMNNDTIERLNMFTLKNLNINDVDIEQFITDYSNDDDDDFEDEFEDYEEWDEDDDEN